MTVHVWMSVKQSAVEHVGYDCIMGLIRASATCGVVWAQPHAGLHSMCLLV